MTNTTSSKYTNAGMEKVMQAAAGAEIHRMAYTVRDGEQGPVEDEYISVHASRAGALAAAVKHLAITAPAGVYADHETGPSAEMFETLVAAGAPKRDLKSEDDAAVVLTAVDTAGQLCVDLGNESTGLFVAIGIHRDMVKP